MEREHHIISCYESMSLATTDMLAAARRNDWDGVIAAERNCSQIVENLKRLGDLVPTDPQLRQRKLEIIIKVLADDAEIRNLTQPWLQQLEVFLKNAGTTRKLSHAYGAVSPANE
ncbi:MAG: flagellar protein FliT [Pseudomonadota bacterium]